MYILYAKLKDTFGEKVPMLYTNTDSFYFQFFVEDLSSIGRGGSDSPANQIRPIAQELRNNVKYFAILRNFCETLRNRR